MRGRLDLSQVNRSDADWCDSVIEALLIALLAFGPLTFGTVHAWSQEVAVAFGAGLSVVLLLKLLLFRTARFVWSWTYVPVAVLILVVALQLIPLPASLISLISPRTVALRSELLAGSSGNVGLPQVMPLSFYPHATAHDLRVLLVLAAIFVVIVNVYHQPVRIKRLLVAVAVIGGFFALLALAQDVAGNGRIYWLIPAAQRAFSGPFVNHSHYGQFMNLSMGAALGLLLVKLHEAFIGTNISPRQVAEFISSAEARTVKLIVAMLLIGAATVFVSLTRGGMVSMLISAGFTTLVLSSRRSLRGRSWIIVLMALGAFICVLYVGFDEVYNRLAALRALNSDDNHRWQIVRDTLDAWTQFPIFGTGMGTYSVVYPMFDRGVSPYLASHAENEYVQVIAELGIVGLSALIAMGVVVWVKYGRLIGSPSVPIRSAAYGLGFGLLAILIHSLSDFGQHLPANAVLSVVFCGLLICLAEIKPRVSAAPQFLHAQSRSGLSRAIVIVPVMAIWIWALLGADNARKAQTAWNRTLATESYLQNNNWQGDDRMYADLISHASAAAVAEPDNVYYSHWLNVYRWRSLERHIDPNAGQLPQGTLPMVNRIISEFRRTRTLCPTFGPAYCLAGELQVFVLDDPNGAENIRKGYRLAPTDPTTCFTAARMDVLEEKAEDAFDKLKRACELDESCFKAAAALCIERLTRADLAQRLAGDDPSRLAYVADLLAASDDRSALAEQIRAAALELQEERCQRPGAPASSHAWLAGAYGRKGDTKDAIDQYRRALTKEYEQVGWHFELAKLLEQTGQLDEAIHELQICLRLQPDYEPARKLMKMLANHPVAVEWPPLNAD